MKLLTSLLLTVMAQVALAAEVTYQWPAVNGLPINNACATEKTFKSVKPITYCSETGVVARYACVYGEAEYCRKLKAGEQPAGNETLREEYGCISQVTQHVEVSRIVKTTECTKWKNNGEAWDGQCTEWSTKESFVGLTFSVQRYKDYGGEVGQVFDGTENYTVAMCPARPN